MASNIVATKLPRAIAREKDGIVLYWSEDLQREGLSQRGLARLLGCNPKTVSAVWDGVTQSSVFEAEVITEGGLQGVTLVDGDGVADILLEIIGSRAKAETRARAKAVSKKLQSAGLKLAVMLELAPDQLSRQLSGLVHQQSQIDKEIHLQSLKLETARLVGDLTTLHGKELAMAAIGCSDQIVKVETVVTEVVQPITGRCDRILTADQLKAEVCKRSGQKLKSMKQFVDRVKAKGRDDLLVPVTRNATSEYVAADRLDEAIRLVYGDERQELLKPRSAITASSARKSGT
jgi:hypothetical protein